MKTIKEMFNEKINKENIKNNVVGKVNNNYHFKWGLSIACLLVLIGIGGVSTLMLKKQPNNITLSNSSNANVIKFNEPKSSPLDALDVYWSAKEKSLDEFILEYPWIKNIPSKYILDASEMLYGFEDKYFGNMLLYKTENSEIIIYFSRYQGQMPRCIRYDVEKLEESIINGVSMKLIEHQLIEENEYIAFFQKDGLYFDVSVYGTQEDFIQLLESITE